MKTNKIPAGYRFIFSTYEGNLNVEKTIIKEGVNKNEAGLLSDLAKILKSHGTGIENVYQPNQEALENAHKVLLPIFNKHKSVFSKDKLESFENNFENIVDYINKMILGYSSTSIYFRELENYQIQYFKEDVEFEDVTNKSF